KDKGIYCLCNLFKRSRHTHSLYRMLLIFCENAVCMRISWIILLLKQELYSNGIFFFGKRSWNRLADRRVNVLFDNMERLFPFIRPFPRLIIISYSLYSDFHWQIDQKMESILFFIEKNVRNQYFSNPFAFAFYKYKRFLFVLLQFFKE